MAPEADGIISWLSSAPIGSRNKLLYLDANCGVTQAQRDFFASHLDEFAVCSLRGQELSPNPTLRVVSDFSFYELMEHQFRLATDSALCSPVRMWLRNRSDEDAISALAKDGRLYFPILPWAASKNGQVFDGACAVTASPRTIVWERVNHRALLVKADHSPNVRNSIPVPARLRPLSLARHFVMSKIFGVDLSIDTNRIREADVVHSLALSAQMEKVALQAKTRVGIFSEIGGVVTDEGYGCILREAYPFPYSSSASLYLPYVSVVGESDRKAFDLFGALVRSTKIQPSQFAIDLALSYMLVWHELLFTFQMVMTTPHAQNAHFELTEDNQIGRVILQDMRDLEDWRAYSHITSKNQRLSSIDRTYLRYQMTVHPIYFDIGLGRADDEWLAESVFNYSFQMLRNYVIRGLELALLPFGRQEHERFRVSIIVALEMLAAGERYPHIREAPLTKSGRRASAVDSWRNMRRQWVRLAVTTNSGIA